jgi:hypothetical protein
MKPRKFFEVIEARRRALGALSTRSLYELLNTCVASGGADEAAILDIALRLSGRLCILARRFNVEIGEVFVALYWAVAKYPLHEPSDADDKKITWRVRNGILDELDRELRHRRRVVAYAAHRREHPLTTRPVALDRLLIREVFAHLPARDIDVLVPSIVCRCRPSDLGRQLGIGLDTARKRVERANRRLRAAAQEVARAA